MRSATARERTRHAALSAMAPGNGIKRSTTIRTLHPPRQTETPRRSSRPYAGDPAVGAGSRSVICGDSSCADDDGSATVGWGEAVVGCSVGVGCGSSVCVGVGDAAVGAGTPGFSLFPFPGLPAGGADRPAPADGEAEGDADSPSFSRL